jgi:hypothetical protein
LRPHIHIMPHISCRSGARRIKFYRQLTRELLVRKLSDFLTTKFDRFKTPIQQVLLTLEAEGLLPERIIALELFGKSGLFTVKDYVSLTEYLELYELDPFSAKYAKVFFPQAQVVNADAIEVTRSGKLLRDDYNFIVIDNPDIPVYCGGRYCEHFDLFPHLVGNAASSAILIMNVILDTRSLLARYPELNFREWLNRRAAFYGLEIGQVERFTPSQLISEYTRKFGEYGKVKYVNIVLRRDIAVGFLVLCLEKTRGT